MDNFVGNGAQWVKSAKEALNDIQQVRRLEIEAS
jgi:hypothetical protein